MTVPGNSALLLTFLAVFSASMGYAAGRLHQRWRTGDAWDNAYREGYDSATRSVFSLAARVIGPRRSAARGAASVPPSGPSRTAPAGRDAPAAPRNAVNRFPRRSSADRAADREVGAGRRPVKDRPVVEAVAVAEPGGRHTVPDELVRAATYRLPADRVARATVPQPSADSPAADETSTMPDASLPIPKPRG